SAMPVAGAKPSPFTRCIHARPHYFLENLIELHPRPTQVSNSISAGDARVRVVAVRHFGTAIVRFGSTAVVSGILALGPLHLNDQTLSERAGPSRSCRFCCKSPQLSGDNFLAIRRSDRRAAIFIASVALARSLTSLSSGDEVPHMFTRTSRLWPLEFLISSAKRLLQQNLPIPRLEQVQQTEQAYSMTSSARASRFAGIFRPSALAVLVHVFETEDGNVVARTAGTSQGGVISPLLANLFLHYTFDMWMTRTYPHIPFERFADDIICHCKSAEEIRRPPCRPALCRQRGPTLLNDSHEIPGRGI